MYFEKRYDCILRCLLRELRSLEIPESCSSYLLSHQILGNLEFEEMLGECFRRAQFHFDQFFEEALSAALVLWAKHSAQDAFRVLYLIGSFLTASLERTIFESLRNVQRQESTEAELRDQTFIYSHPYRKLVSCLLASVFQETRVQQFTERIRGLSLEKEYAFFYSHLQNERFTESILRGPVQLKVGWTEARLESFRKYFLESNPTQKFRFQFLRQTFLQLSRDFFFRMCLSCNNYPQYNGAELYQCLVCGYQLCSHSCKPGEIRCNMFRHSKKYHQGKSIFINLQKATVIAISDPIGVKLESGLYYNKLG